MRGKKKREVAVLKVAYGIKSVHFLAMHEEDILYCKQPMQSRFCSDLRIFCKFVFCTNFLILELHVVHAGVTSAS